MFLPFALLLQLAIIMEPSCSTSKLLCSSIRQLSLELAIFVLQGTRQALQCGLLDLKLWQLLHLLHPPCRLHLHTNALTGLSAGGCGVGPGRKRACDS